MKTATRLLLLFGGEFSPADIADLFLWLDASNGVYQDSALTTVAGNGDVVGGWKDKSVNANHVTQAVTAAKPTLVSVNANFNNQPTISFVTDDLLRTTFSAIAQPNEIFCVMKYDSGVPDGTIAIDGEGAGRNVIFKSAGSIFSIFAGAVLEGRPWDSNTHILGGVFDGANSLVIVDGVIVGTGDPGSDSLIGLTVGAALADVNYLDGDIAEIIIYNRALAISERNQVEQYLSSRYGIALNQRAYSSGYNAGYA